MKFLVLLVSVLAFIQSASANTASYYCVSGDYEMSFSLEGSVLTVWEGNSDWSYADGHQYQGHLAKVTDGLAVFPLKISAQNRQFPAPEKAEIQIPEVMLKSKVSSDVTFETIVYSCW